MFWQVTCALNTTKALVPFQHRLRSAKQRVLRPRIGAGHASVVSGGIDHVRALRAGGLDLRGARILEIGSGWFPIIPLILRMAGAGRVVMTDAHRLMGPAGVAAALGFVRQHAGEIREALELGPRDGLDLEAAEAVAATEEDVDRLLDRLGLDYLAPFDAGRDAPPVDAVVSQTVFEHIPPAILEAILAGTRATLRPGGLVSHGIDNTDHRANHDPRLGRFDFLKYSDETWALFCINPQDYTNRLRHSDYMRMIGSAGFEVVSETALVMRNRIPEVERMRLPSRFAGRSPEDLVTHWSHIVARPAA